MRNVIYILIPISILTVACTANSNIQDDNPSIEMQSPTVHELTGNQDKHKNIFVFLDGTGNGPESNTNIWRLYNQVLEINDPQMTAIYIKGVGTTVDPLDTKKIGSIETTVELALGKNMQQRILKGYEFIANNYNYSSGDKLYIFGFSRGAHEARSLAGLIAYAGVPKLSAEDKAKSAKDKNYVWDIGNDVLELTKKKIDEDYLKEWKSWTPGDKPLLASEIKDKTIKGQKGREMQPAEVSFLGIWDTVPGSSFKDYGYCKEKRGFVKRYLYWMIPGVDKGERYKTDSYPAIRHIAHAVSLDEKRSKFAPILACPAINSKFTTVSEVWFPGAHADVGGGYDDSANKLPSISLNWMIGLLNGLNENDILTKPIQAESDASIGLAHWSIGDSPANMFSDCIDRDPHKNRPDNALPVKIDASVNDRIKQGLVPINMNGSINKRKYPMLCQNK